MAEAPAKTESAARRWLTRAALAAPFVLAITGFIFRYEMSHFLMMRRARATPPDTSAFDWIATDSRTPIRDLTTLLRVHPELSSMHILRTFRERPAVLFSMTADELDAVNAFARHESENVRRLSFDLHMEFPIPGAVSALKNALSDSRSGVRYGALQISRSFRFADDPDWLAAVTRLTEDANADVRGQAWLTLGESGKAEQLPRFLDALEKEERVTQYYVILGMGKLAAPGALPTVRRCLSDDRPELAGAACRALCDIGEAEDVERLISLLAQSDRTYTVPGSGNTSGLHSQIEMTLGLLTGENLGLDCKRWQRWWESNGASYDYDEIVKSALLDSQRWAWAYRRIASRNMRHLLPVVREAAEEGDSRWHAHALLAWFGDTEAALVLVGLLDHDDAGARFWALRLLHRATLMDFFTDTDAWREWLEARRPNFREHRERQE